jgi:D-galactarolactone cycloisomerase
MAGRKAMLRRDVIKALPAAALLSPMFANVAAAAGAGKITDVRVVPLKVVRETGMMESAWDPGVSTMRRIGGGTFVEIHTDQGLIGIGPTMDTSLVKAAKTLLVGRDPFDIEKLAGPLRYEVGRGVSSLEIALWDLIGKAAGQPVYKLWGAGRDRVPAYASMIQLSTPVERARMAVMLKGQGWKAIKLRLHYETMKEDIQVVAAVRKAVGDDMVIMTDANQAQTATGWQAGVRWDFQRALDTARELEKLNVAWLEEPLPRYDLDGLAELNQQVSIPIVGGEHGIGVKEFREILTRRVFDLVQPDVMTADGVRGIREIAALADAFDKPIVPHHGGGYLGTIAQLHCIASWPNAPWIEILHDPPIEAYTNRFSIFSNPPLVDKDGFIAVPQGPGWGVEIDKALIA